MKAPVPSPPGAPGHPHLANNTVPCSSGLLLTARQLCRISSDSGRSMLAQGREAQVWYPRGAGAVTARATPSQRVMLATLQPLQPLSLVPAGSNHHSFPVLGRGTPTLPAPLALLGTPLRLLHPALRGSESAPPRAAPLGRFKATAVSGPSVHQGAHLRPTETTWCLGNARASHLNGNHRASLHLFLTWKRVVILPPTS